MNDSNKINKNKEGDTLSSPSYEPDEKEKTDAGFLSRLNAVIEKLQQGSPEDLYAFYLSQEHDITGIARACEMTDRDCQSLIENLEEYLGSEKVQALKKDLIDFEDKKGRFNIEGLCESEDKNNKG